MMNTYTWNAQDYANQSSAQQLWAEELLQKLNLQGDERVLDLGCGDGKVTVQLASFVPNGSVVGIDNSTAMIRFAEAKYPRERFSNLQFILADARYLGFYNQFDRVFSNAVLHWVDDHLSVLQGIHRSLQPGGKMLLQMGGKGNIPGMLEAVDIVTQSMRWQTYFHHFSFPYYFYGVEDYQQWLEIANLQPIRVELLPKTIIYQSPIELAGWIRTTWLPYTQQVPPQWREDFISDLATCYLALYPETAEGTIQVQVVRLEVEASK